MGGFVRGDVLVVRFPFTDLTSEKRRPALVLAALDRGDHIICQVTSRPYHDPSIRLGQEDFVEGGLPRESYARPDQIFTANEDIVERKAGQLGKPTVSAIQDALRNLLLD